jgi:2-keto-4-pentenoate hydratase
VAAFVEGPWDPSAELWLRALVITGTIALITSGTLLVGPPQALRGLGADVIAALQSFILTLSCDGRQVETARGSNVLGSPLSAITHLMSVLGKESGDALLQAGEMVTTGTVTTARSVRAWEIWKSEIRGIALPGLTVEFST